VPEGEELVLELDELWSYVGGKHHPFWHWIAFCRSTRQVVAYVIGDRSEKSCRLLWERLPERYRAATSYSDFWSAYAALCPEEQHQSVGKESGETNHVERWNCTLRQRLGRFVRKTLSFSKSLAMHEGCFRLFLHTYNLSLRAA
jgi:insertion element IS1 protein InsB